MLVVYCCHECDWIDVNAALNNASILLMIFAALRFNGLLKMFECFNALMLLL